MVELKVISNGIFYKGVTRGLLSPWQPMGRKKFTVGRLVQADGIDTNPSHDCGVGINFCRTIAEALYWGPVVVALKIPDGEIVVDTGGKLRARSVEVIEQADLREADLRRADLSEADLFGADLFGANLSGAMGYNP